MSPRLVGSLNLVWAVWAVKLIFELQAQKRLFGFFKLSKPNSDCPLGNQTYKPRCPITVNLTSILKSRIVDKKNPLVSLMKEHQKTSFILVSVENNYYSHSSYTRRSKKKCFRIYILLNNTQNLKKMWIACTTKFCI